MSMVVRAPHGCAPGHPLSRAIALIQATVADHYRLDVFCMLHNGRSRTVVRARQMAMFLARDLTDGTLEQIGALFFRHHSTVLYAEQRVAQRRRESARFRDDVHALTAAVIAARTAHA